MCSIKFWPGDSRNHPEVHRVPGGRAAKRFHQTVLGHRPCQPPQGQGPPLSPSSLWGGERLTSLQKQLVSWDFQYLSHIGTFSQTSRRPHSCQEPRYELMLIFCCYWLLVIWTRRSNSSENSASFSIATISCLNDAEPIFVPEFDIRKFGWRFLV